MKKKLQVLGVSAVGLAIVLVIFFSDFDGDGLSNLTEIQLGTAFDNPDTDEDGLIDGLEVNFYKTNPLVTDTDGDGLSDEAEVNIYHTDPIFADTDGDGLDDGLEVFEHRTDPLKTDTDGDNLGDRLEILIHGSDPLVADTDNDGINDGSEVNFYGTDPLHDDTDNDRLLDGLEINGWSITINGSAVTVTSSPFSKDSDGDGLSDWAEYNTYHSDPRSADSDGDGYSDPLEVLYNRNPSEASSVPQPIEGAPSCPKLSLEIDYVSGYVPSPDAIGYLESYFKHDLGVEVEVIYDEITSVELTSIGVSPSSIGAQELVSIERHFHDNPMTHLYVFYAGKFDEENIGGLASSYGVALNGEYVFSDIARERTILFHKVGHCLGLEHCDNPSCAMQSGPIFLNPIYCRDTWAQRNLLDVWSVDEPWA